MLKLILKSFTTFIALSLLFQSSASAKISQEASTNEVIKEIERTLLFNKESRKKINIYQKDKSVKKSDYVIKAGGNKNVGYASNNDQERSIEIIVVDPKSNSFDLRKKEKLAYNAALIGQYEVAVELYKQVLAQEPNNEYSQFSLAVVYQQLGQFNQAKTLYRNLLKNGVENEDEVIGNLLAILIEQTPKDASYLLGRLSIQSPKSSYILAQAAVVYDKMKQYSSATTLLERAIYLDPENIGYKYNLAIVYDKDKKYAEALNKYLEVVKDYSEADRSLIAIEQVKARIKAIRGSV